MTYTQFKKVLDYVKINEFIVISFNNFRLMGTLEKYNQSIVTLKYGKKFTHIPIDSINYVETVTYPDCENLAQKCNDSYVNSDYEFGIYTDNKNTKERINQMKSNDNTLTVGFQK